jgi:hypothetical protein
MNYSSFLLEFVPFFSYLRKMCGGIVSTLLSVPSPIESQQWKSCVMNVTELELQRCRSAIIIELYHLLNVG